MNVVPFFFFFFFSLTLLFRLIFSNLFFSCLVLPCLILSFISFYLVLSRFNYALIITIDPFCSSNFLFLHCFCFVQSCKCQWPHTFILLQPNFALLSFIYSKNSNIQQKLKKTNLLKILNDWCDVVSSHLPIYQADVLIEILSFDGSNNLIGCTSLLLTKTISPKPNSCHKTLTSP